jgi:hypothetical protein
MATRFSIDKVSVGCGCVGVGEVGRGGSIPMPPKRDIISFRLKQTETEDLQPVIPRPPCRLPGDSGGAPPPLRPPLPSLRPSPRRRRRVPTGQSLGGVGGGGSFSVRAASCAGPMRFGAGVGEDSATAAVPGGRSGGALARLRWRRHRRGAGFVDPAAGQMGLAGLDLGRAGPAAAALCRVVRARLAALGARAWCSRARLGVFGAAAPGWGSSC